MMRSLFSGVSGLKSHQTRMDVIGNNIANVNTTGFKSSRTTFADTLSQTLTGASSPQDNLGGTNPKQIGLGTGVASIDMLFTDGSVQSTGKNTDLCLSGNGLFVVKQGNQTYYTRDGAFAFDADGNYVLPSSGLYVQGWTATDGVLNTSGAVGNIQIAAGKSMEAKKTETASYTNNLKANTEGYEISSITVQYADGSTAATGLSSYKADSVSKGAITLGTDTNKSITLDDTAAYSFKTGDSLKGKTLWTSKIDSVQASGDVTLTLETGNVIAGIDGATTLTCANPLKDGNSYSIGSTYTIKGTIDAQGVQVDSPAPGKTTLAVTLSDDANKGKQVKITVPNPQNYSYKDGDSVSFALPIASIKAGKDAVVNTANGQQATLENDLEITKADQKYEYKGTDADGNVVSVQRVGQGTAYTYNGKEVSSVNIVTTDGRTLTGLAGAEYKKGKMFYPTITTSLSIYDTEGKSHSVPLLLTKTEANTWKASLAGGTNSTTITEDNGDMVTVSLDSSDIKFDTAGKYVSGAGTLNLTYADHDGKQTTADQSVAINFASLTQYSGSSTVKGDTDGNAAGTLSSVSVDSSGVITGTYTNGIKQAEAQVAIAQFTNASGLTKTGNSLYQESNNSGTANVKTASDLGVTITPSALEMSNVDIANEFSDMIITQRGFQSNSKIITVGDEMLETLINMKR